MRGKAAAERGTAEEAARKQIELEEVLRRRGVSPAFAEALSGRLATLAAVLPPGSFEAALEGVVLAYRVHREEERFVERSRHDLEEIHRMMDGFTGELRKLDEALQILSAYVTRVRDKAAGGILRTVH
jgi:hypothetical protein